MQEFYKGITTKEIEQTSNEILLDLLEYYVATILFQENDYQSTEQQELDNMKKVDSMTKAVPEIKQEILKRFKTLREKKDDYWHQIVIANLWKDE